MRRGLGNPGDPRRDADKAIRQKFTAMKTLFQKEGQIPSLRNPDSLTRDSVIKLAERKIKDIVESLGKASEADKPDLLAKLAAANHWKTTVETKGLETSGVVDATKNFYAWVLGKGVEEDHRRTPWYRTPALLDLPDVREWVDSYVDVLTESQTELLKLAWKTPQSLEEAWAYYKFIVHQEWMKKEDRFIWVDLLNLLEERAMLGGGMTARDLETAGRNPAVEVQHRGQTHLVPLTQADVFDPSKVTGRQGPPFLPPALTAPDTVPRVTLEDQLAEMSESNKLSSLEPRVKELPTPAPGEVDRLLEEMQTKVSKQDFEAEQPVIGPNFVPGEERLSHPALRGVRDALDDVAAVLPQKEGLLVKLGNLFAWSAGSLLSLPEEESPPPGEYDRDKTQKLLNIAREKADSVNQASLPVKAQEELLEAKTNLRILQNELNLESKVGPLVGAGQYEFARDVLSLDTFKPMDTYAITSQADLLAKQAGKGLGSEAKKSTQTALRLGVLLDQFQSDRTAFMLQGRGFATQPFVEKALTRRWEAALKGVGVGVKELDEFRKKGVDLAKVPFDATAAQQFSNAVLGSLGQQGEVLSKLSRMASAANTLAELQSLAPTEFDSSPYLEKLRAAGIDAPDSLKENLSGEELLQASQLEELGSYLKGLTVTERSLKRLGEFLQSFAGGLATPVLMSATDATFQFLVRTGLKYSLSIGVSSTAPAAALSLVSALVTRSLFGGFPTSFGGLARFAQAWVFGKAVEALFAGDAALGGTDTMTAMLGSLLGDYGEEQAKQAGEKAFAVYYARTAEGLAGSSARNTGMALLAGAFSMLTMAGPVSAVPLMIGSLVTGLFPTLVATGAGMAGQAVASATSQAGTYVKADAVRSAIGGTEMPDVNRLVAALPLASWLQAQFLLSSVGQTVTRLKLMTNRLMTDPTSVWANFNKEGNVPLTAFDTEIGARGYAMLQLVAQMLTSFPGNTMQAFQGVVNSAIQASNLKNLNAAQVEANFVQWQVQQRLAEELRRKQIRGARKLKPVKKSAPKALNRRNIYYPRNEASPGALE